MPEQVEDYYTWDIVEYLKEFAPPRFLDRHQLTGRIKMVQGRTNRAQLVHCVGLLYEAWREALQAIGALTDVVEAEKEKEEEEDEDAEEELDAQEFAERLARQLESFCVEPLDNLLQEEEASAAAARTRSGRYRDQPPHRLSRESVGSRRVHRALRGRVEAPLLACCKEWWWRGR